MLILYLEKQILVRLDKRKVTGLSGHKKPGVEIIRGNIRFLKKDAPAANTMPASVFVTAARFSSRNQCCRQSLEPESENSCFQFFARNVSNFFCKPASIPAFSGAPP
jgi:hypothetical protein